MTEKITRSESMAIKVEVEVTAKNIKYLKEKYRVLMKGKCFALTPEYILNFALTPEYILNFDYRFNIDYLDDTDKQFRAILAMTERKDVNVVAFDMKTLNRTRSLLLDLVRSIDKFKAKIDQGGR